MCWLQAQPALLQAAARAPPAQVPSYQQSWQPSPANGNYQPAPRVGPSRQILGSGFSLAQAQLAHCAKAEGNAGMSVQPALPVIVV